MTALVCPVVRQSHAWCRPHPRIRHDERWIGELRDAIFTFDERYNIDHIVPLHGHFCPIIGIQATHPRNAPRETSTATAPTHGSEQTQQPVRGVVGSWGTRRGLHPCAEGFGRFTYTTHRCHSTTMPRSSPMNSVGRGMANRPELRAWSE